MKAKIWAYLSVRIRNDLSSVKNSKSVSMFKIYRMQTLAAIVVGASLCSTVSSASDLETAYKIIASKRFVDLTQIFDPATPVWSGF